MPQSNPRDRISGVHQRKESQVFQNVRICLYMLFRQLNLIDDANNSFEIGQNNNGSQIIQDINIENPQINEAQLEWKLKSSFEAHSAAVYAVCSYQNQLYSSSNKCFKVWSLDTLKPVSEISAHHSFIKTMIVWPEK